MEAVKYSFRIAISFLFCAYSSSGISSQDELARAVARFDRLEMDFTQEVYDRYVNLIDKGHKYSDTSALMLFDELNN